MHVRRNDSCENVQNLARDLVEEKFVPLVQKGTWVSTLPKILTIKADQTIERNRRGFRFLECQELLSVQDNDNEEKGDDDSESDADEYTTTQDDNGAAPLSSKSERHVIFAHWLVETYGVELLSKGSGVLDVAGGNGEISRTLHELGVPSNLLDPNPRCGDSPPFETLPYALNGNGSDLTNRSDKIGDIIRNCSFICGMHPDQATEPIVDLALALNVPFAVLPCCVMPSLFPHRRQKRHNDPVRSYSAFCQYLLDMAPPTCLAFRVGHLPFIGSNKVIYS